MLRRVPAERAFSSLLFYGRVVRRENEKGSRELLFALTSPLSQIATDLPKLSLAEQFRRHCRVSSRLLSRFNKFAATFSRDPGDKASPGACGDDSARTLYSYGYSSSRRNDASRPPPESPLSSQTVHPSTTCDVVQRTTT